MLMQAPVEVASNLTVAKNVPVPNSVEGVTVVEQVLASCDRARPFRLPDNTSDPESEEKNVEVTMERNHGRRHLRHSHCSSAAIAQ